jgi:hypothetical protein
MGQYYRVIFLAEKQDGSKEIIRAWIDAYPCKLMEHSYQDDALLNFVEYLLCREGMFYRSRIVWAGDYADPEEQKKVLTREESKFDSKKQKEEEENSNLYQSCKENGTMLRQLRMPNGFTGGHYLVNHTKKQYVDKRRQAGSIHPLPLLVSEGNGRGGGDYFGRNEELCGTWARDVISMEEKDGIPSDYTELVCDFCEE